jgi:hypothetical protein
MYLWSCAHMKTFLIVSCLIVAAAISAEAQTARGTFTAPTGDTRTDRTERRVAPTTRTREAGAIPRAARGGNPIQMINPMAPRRYYGDVEDTVTYDPNDPRRITGLILLGLRW